MLDDVNGPYLTKSAIAERKRIFIEIGYDVRARVRVPIHANGAGILVDAAADVEYGKVMCAPVPGHC